MSQKPKIIYILIILWIVIGVLFCGMAIKKTFDHLDYLDSFSGFSTGPSQTTTAMTFSYVQYTILFIIIIVLSCILVYGTFIKKSWTWLISIMLSSFLLFFTFQAITYIGYGLIMENLFEFFNHFDYLAYILMLFFVPFLTFILIRPEVKTYFQKTDEQSHSKEREIVTENKMITKTIKCPACGEIQEVQGVIGKKVEIICKKCNNKGFFNFF